MNIDSKFAKGMDASAQARAVLGAPLGKLPPAGTVKRDALERFEAELTARARGSRRRSTRSRRSRCARASRASPRRRRPHGRAPRLRRAAAARGRRDELRARRHGARRPLRRGFARRARQHPRGRRAPPPPPAAGAPPPAAGPDAELEQLVTSDGRKVSNMDLLQPNKDWPGDHCAVLCLLESDARARARTRRSRERAAERRGGGGGRHDRATKPGNARCGRRCRRPYFDRRGVTA